MMQLLGHTIYVTTYKLLDCALWRSHSKVLLKLSNGSATGGGCLGSLGGVSKKGGCLVGVAGCLGGCLGPGGRRVVLPAKKWNVSLQLERTSFFTFPIRITRQVVEAPPAPLARRLAELFWECSSGMFFGNVLRQKKWNVSLQLERTSVFTFPIRITRQVVEVPPAPLARRLGKNKNLRKMTSTPKNHATAAHTAAHTPDDKASKINQISRAAPADLKCTPHHPPSSPLVGVRWK